MSLLRRMGSCVWLYAENIICIYIRVYIYIYIYMELCKGLVEFPKSRGTLLPVPETGLKGCEVYIGAPVCRETAIEIRAGLCPLINNRNPLNSN